MEVTVRKLAVEDAPLLVGLRREALEAEPLAFVSSPADDLMLQGESVRTLLMPSDTHATYGAFKQQTLVGMVGLVRLTKVKQRHKAMVLGMYVQTACRSHGIGHALLNAVIQQARAWSIDQLQLSVTETAVGAKRLYESVGFRAWGTEPRAVHWGDKFFGEHHLALTLSEFA